MTHESGMNPAQATAIIASRVFDGAMLHSTRAVLVRGGDVLGIATPADVPADFQRVELPNDALLAPGFIDVQVNGGGGILLNDTPTPDAMAAIARVHRRFGTTGCLPTLITDHPQAMVAAVGAARHGVGRPGVLGVHLEGPFLNPERAGVHRKDLIAVPTIADLDVLSDLRGVGASQVTLAPERAPAGFINGIAKLGVRISAGHTDATHAQMMAACDEGLTGITHLYNATSQLQAREPGVVGAALADRRIFAGVICDGIHVDPVTLGITHRAKGADRVMLVTDAMPSLGANIDRFMLTGMEIFVRDGKLTRGDGMLAGAHLDMASAVRNAVEFVGLKLTDALAMASLTPAKFLGIDDKRGRIAPGYAADLVALDGKLGVIGTWIAGGYAAAT